MKCSSFALSKQTNKSKDPDKKWIESRKALNGINSWSECSSEGSREVSLRSSRIYESRRVEQGGKMALENIQSEEPRKFYENQCSHH